MSGRPELLTRVSNPPNPWIRAHVDWVGRPPEARLQVFEDHSRSILSENRSPDIPFRWSVNPYRGCYHGCAYCYARPTHGYLGLGAGTDFERTLVVKPRAAELLDRALGRRGWRGERIVFSGNTDCYQPLEASLGLTRQCLETCLRYRNPVGVITKSALVERDADLLAELAQEAGCEVTISVPFLDPADARAIEPYVPSPRRRFQAIRTLAEAGVPVGVTIAPIIPGLNDEAIPGILEAAREAGATWADHVLLRLPGVVHEVFEARLRSALPLRADRVMGQVASCRQGAVEEARFGHRMRGRGDRWAIIAQLFATTCARLGFPGRPSPREPSPYRRPPSGDRNQLQLL